MQARPKPIRYVFWDSDNTLIDTFALHWGKTVNVLKAHGITLDNIYKRKVHENNGAQNWAWIRAELGLAIPQDQYLHEVDTWYAAHSNEFRLRDGIEPTIAIFDQARCRQCVITNGRRKSVMISHEATNLLGRFAFLLCKEDYTGRKPDPAPYLAGLKKMSEIEGRMIDPDECLAIEDDPLGVESAKRAGMVTIFRPTELVNQTSSFADYTVTYPDDLQAVARSLVHAPGYAVPNAPKALDLE